MNVKDAVHEAKKHVLDLFAEEQITNLGLEEVEYVEGKADGVWKITLGFSRPWDEKRNTFAAKAADVRPVRNYKVVQIDDPGGRLVSIKNRVYDH